MPQVFGNTENYRGCFYAFRIDSSASRGGKLKLPDSKTIPWADNFTDPILLTGFSFSQRDIATFVKVFGDRVYTYAFGHDPTASMVTVEFAGFLVDGKKYSGVVDEVNTRYRDNRVYANPKYAKLALGSGSNDVLRGFVVGMDSSTIDSHHSIQKFSMLLAMVEVQ